jgi:RNA polymerase sigma-70 factor (ECF subfamily)
LNEGKYPAGGDGVKHPVYGGGNKLAVVSVRLFKHGRQPPVGRTVPLPEESNTRRFQRIALPHLDAAYNLARWLVRRPEDADDVVQDAMLRAFRAFEGCREATARAWLLRIVRNVAYDRLKTYANRAESGFADVDPDDPEGARFTTDAFTGAALDPEGMLVKEDHRRLLNALIAGLPIGFREVVILRELEELTYKEIAEVADIPIGTVMSRLARARDLLQKAWSDRNG